MDKIDVLQKFTLFDDYWSPKIVGEINGQYIKLARLKGEFVWHSHEDEDEFFLVVKGTITIHMREQSIALGEGEFFIVPKGVEHKPEALEEALVMMVVSKTAHHTGNINTSLTVEIGDQQRL